MRIKSIRYPEGCELKGWGKMVFERRLQRALGSFFSVCDLEQCRTAICGQEPDRERYDELNVFHCVSFKDMSAAEAQALVDKTAEYVGVEISITHASRVSRVAAAFVGGILIGSACAWAVPAVTAAKSAMTQPLSTRPASVDALSPVLPLPRMPELPLAPDPEPIFSTKVRTARPGATAISLARAVRNDAGEYEVSLTVTPIDAATGQ
jgi:hypothetical protein